MCALYKCNWYQLRSHRAVDWRWGWFPLVFCIAKDYTRGLLSAGEVAVPLSDAQHSVCSSQARAGFTILTWGQPPELEIKLRHLSSPSVLCNRRYSRLPGKDMEAGGRLASQSLPKLIGSFDEVLGRKMRRHFHWWTGFQDSWSRLHTDSRQFCLMKEVFITWVAENFAVGSPKL